MKDPNPASRRGYSLALGVLPRAFVVPKLDEVINALIEAARIQVTYSLFENLIKKEASDQRDAETRRNAIQALSNFASNVGIISDSGILNSCR